ncbi:C-Maf-inducing protein-like isoform X2 [Clytia hemisphaerica]|uniref:C-Maf-inducing protein-like isoform X2 n=1 Tax=Clytia hemisphaerica TaxID=252671 RepID=UPI0034D7500E
MNKFCINNDKTAIQQALKLLTDDGNKMFLKKFFKKRKTVHKEPATGSEITASRIRKLHTKIKRSDELINELKELINTCLAMPISDSNVFQLPLNAVSSLLLLHGHEIGESLRVEILKVTAPILELTSLPSSMCKCFQRITKNQIHSQEIVEVFLPSVEKVLKHNTDFGKFPHLRIFVQDFLCALYDNRKERVKEFIQSLHTANMTCPHPRVLPNMVTVSLAAIYSVYEEEHNEHDKKRIQQCFIVVFETMYGFSDWISNLAVLLQAVPFPAEALKDETFQSFLAKMMETFAKDNNCEVHQSILPIREEKDGWVHHFAPGGVCCHDDGTLFSNLMSHLIKCCCKRKKMLLTLKNTMLGLFTLMAIRGDKYCIEALVSLLDFDLMKDEEENLEIIAALQSSDEGQKQYDQLCTKKEEFINMKKSGGPHKLTLPSQSTDEDLIHVLKNGSFGNLQSLNLAFTSVTSDSADYIIKLPSLIHLNLWATQFDDRGLILISEHLPKLQSLNLCETAVTDEGLNALVFLENLQILNLNSTKLSALTYEMLKEKLQELKVVDLRYTEAWP